MTRFGQPNTTTLGNLTQPVGNMARTHIRQALRQHPFTKGLPGLEKLEDLTEGVSFQEDQIVFAAGESSPYLYLLTSGSVCVEISASVYTVCIQALGPGKVFGWSSLLDQHNTAFRVRAREASSALRLDAARLAPLCREEPGLGVEIFHGLAELVGERLRSTEERLAEFCGVSCLPAGRRLNSCPHC